MVSSIAYSSIVSRFKSKQGALILYAVLALVHTLSYFLRTDSLYFSFKVSAEIGLCVAPDLFSYMAVLPFSSLGHMCYTTTILSMFTKSFEKSETGLAMGVSGSANRCSIPPHTFFVWLAVIH